ncbi:MAG: hypothetical protein IPJ19_07595 [Planctomycetes bacterium]|nr:hypothetical protein [Planctomycetota bacterium]
MSSHEGALASGSEPELLRALELHLPGLEFLDRELEIQCSGEMLHAALLVGRTGDGSLVLLDELRGPPERCALRALELLAIAREHAGELQQRFGCARGPQLVLFVGEHARELAGLLAPLLGHGLLLFSSTRLRTRAGTRFSIAPLADASAPQALPTREDFLATLDAGARALLDVLWERLAAPALGAHAEIGQAGVRWSDARGALCSLARGEQGLVGRISGLEEGIELGNEAEVRGFLDAVVALHLERLVGELEAPAEASTQAAFDPREPVLSAAEIAAFQQV